MTLDTFFCCNFKNFFLSAGELQSFDNETDEDDDSSSIDNVELLKWLAWSIKIGFSRLIFLYSDNAN